MKNLFIKYVSSLLLFTLIFSKDLSAQTGCGFLAPAEAEPVFENYTSTDITVYLAFHIIRRSNQTGGASSSDLGNYMTELYDVYHTSGIFFDTLCTNFIDSTALYDDCDSKLRANWASFQSRFESPNAVNVFIHPGSCSDEFGNGNINGYSCWIQNNGHRNLISHEIGHVLNLLHTFENSYGMSCYSDPSSLIYKGDLCEDTPPDTGILFLFFKDCNWSDSLCGLDSRCNDGCGNSPHLGFDPGIMMSDYHSCTSFFTTDQQNRMKDKILNNRSGSYFNLPVADLILDDSFVISTPYRAAANIIIQSGGVLIVTSTLYMPEKAKITIQAGGILSVNGGTITKGNFKDMCHERTGDPRFWHGIEMQFSNSSPPRFACVNGTIEYSENGLHGPDGKPAGNGLISIYNSTFKNNKVSIFIERPPSFSSPISVKRTRFYLDNSFPLSQYYTQVHIDHSKIYFDSCTFDNPNYKKPLTESAYAIRSMSADVSVQHTTFKDSIYGIQSMNFMSKATLGVSICRFLTTRIGINIFNHNSYSITKDTFDSSVKFGLLSNECSGYIINNNYFRRGGGGAVTDSAGIQMNSSGLGENVIEKNVYTAVKHGHVTNGINGDVVRMVGLKFYCNDFSSMSGNDENVFNGQVNGIQGLSDIGAGNTAGDDQVDHALNFTFGAPKDVMVYYYKSGISSHTPDSDPKYRMTKTPVSSYNCSRSYKKPDTVSHLVTYQKYVDSSDLRKTQRTDSIDGGNTTTLLTYIGAANSGNATTLYNHLINKSPWLSEAVVLAAYNRSDIFDSTKRAQIIFNNPDAMRSGALRADIRDADSPLPTSSLDALDTLTLYTTSRTAFEAEITELDLFKSMVCYDILNQLKLDTVDQSDSILVWLERVGDYLSKREIMETHFENGDFTDASSALSDLEEMENLSEDEISDIEGLPDLLDYIATVRDDKRYEGNLSPEEIEWMIDYAENNDNQSGREVRSALLFYYDINVDEPEALRQSKYRKPNPEGVQVKVIDSKAISKKDFIIYPNPSKDELIISVPTEDKGDRWNVKIIDLDGKILKEAGSNNSAFKVGINQIPTGIFIVQLSNLKGNRFTKRIQVIK